MRTGACWPARWTTTAAKGSTAGVTYTAAQSGTHYAAAGAYRGHTGTYKLSVADVTPSADDFSADVTTAGTVAVEGSTPGAIETDGDTDWFAVELAAGATYRIDLKGVDTGDGTLADPRLISVRDATGAAIAGTEADGGGVGQNARLTFTPTEDGTYYVEAGAAGTGTGTYAVEVTDTSTPEVQEPPAFGGQGYAFELAENADGSTSRVSLGTVSATDPEGEALSYSIEGGNGSGRFEIDAASGELFYVGTGEDYESGTASFDLTVRASDGELYTDTTVTVSVTDVQEAPEFAQQGYAFELAENADGSTSRVSLGTVSAVDPEGAALSYGLAGSTGWGGRFDIDATSGELFYTGTGEDYESGTTSFDQTVRVTDGQLYTDTTVTVSVTDVQEVSSEESVSEPDGEDFSANTSTAGRVAVGGAATGEIGFSGDRDWFAVELEAGRTYVFDLEGSHTNRGDLSDPFLRGIYDEEGDFIDGTGADDGGTGLNSRETFTASEDATYYVAAGAAGTGTGTYTLWVTEVPDDYPAGTGTTGTVAVGGSATGEIDYVNDRDWFAVTLETGKTYRIDLKGSTTGDGTLRSPYLRGVHDAVGNLFAGTTNDDGGVGFNSRVTFTAGADATYYVAAGAYADYEGTYTLSVEDVGDGM